MKERVTLSLEKENLEKVRIKQEKEKRTFSNTVDSILYEYFEKSEKNDNRIN
jgi:hypothetical protein